jgi:hypothetical protein
MIVVGQFGSILFTGFISIQAVLIIRYRWTVATMRKVERYFLILGSLLPLVVAVSAASMGSLHPTTGGMCFINASPHFCLYSYLGWCRVNKEWGEHLLFYNLAVAAVILIVLLMVLISMVLLFHTARSQERQAAQWSMTAHEGRAQKAVVKTASLYLCTYIYPCIVIYTNIYMPNTKKQKNIAGENREFHPSFFIFLPPFCPSFPIYRYRHLCLHLLFRDCGNVYEKWQWRIGHGNRIARTRVLQCINLLQTVPIPCHFPLWLPKTKSWYRRCSWWGAPTSSGIGGG